MITPSGRTAVLAIDDASMAGEVRRVATTLAAHLGFEETQRGKVAIVATEAATNLHKHAQGGVIVIQGFEQGSIGAVDLLGLDTGPGMADVRRCMADGFSTAGSPGKGLGAMVRMSAAFDLHSLPGVGTATLARCWSTPAGDHPPPALEFGAVNVPLATEEVCGDSWAIARRGAKTRILVVDGLGHGLHAAEAAREAVRSFRQNESLEPGEIVAAAHAALAGTRGAALAVAQIDLDTHEVRYAGVGNISGTILGPAENQRTSMVSHTGTVGHTVRKIQEFTYAWTAGSELIMHSDGLSTQWQAGQYAGLAPRHPGLLAGVLYRDYKRGRDDVTVVAVREWSANRP